MLRKFHLRIFDPALNPLSHTTYVDIVGLLYIYRFSRSNVRNIRATVILGHSNVNREIISPLSKTNILTGP